MRRTCLLYTSYSYTYYLDGNQASKTDSTGTTSYQYDGLGRLTRESNPSAITKQYSYDSAGNRTGLTVSGSQAYTTAYAYDANNRLTTETKTAGQTKEIYSYTYDENGNQLSRMKTCLLYTSRCV